MKLSKEQLKQFHEEGYLFLPEVFTAEEAKLLKQESENVYSMNRKEVWREKTGVARTAFAAHTYNEGFKRLGAHPRLVNPVKQILEGDVYMHQFKVMLKQRLMVMSGNGIKILEPGIEMTKCQSQEP